MIPWLRPAPDEEWFPDTARALGEPNGLLAAGGDLSPKRLLSAYRRGIFPWYEEGQPILWWSPDPRAVIWPRELHISRRLGRRLRGDSYAVSVDKNFAEVVAGCADRGPGIGTWITPAMARAYLRLHRLGHAHSLEVWQGESLVGGIYGVALGRVFFAESMFSAATDASKIALACLSRLLERHRFRIIDCQLSSAHLASLGSHEMPRLEFVEHIRVWCNEPAAPMHWAQAPVAPRHLFDGGAGD
ncbi:MAG: leucyl/phenylalanyl-tRNA--protein transferase [Gammaproteobacteria bacterium]